MSEFLKDLSAVLNRHSKENLSNTPDWIFAEFLGACLDAHAQATAARERWYGYTHAPGSGFKVDSPEPKP